VAARCGDEERAAFYVASHRSDQPDDEANRIAADHRFSPDRLIAMKGPARTRGVDLGTVLRAAPAVTAGATAVRGTALGLTTPPTGR
jgi:hypothetical protein